ncbi:hypothetical protein G5714_017426 [Onychostoma macrolepis]|uniref:Uncharacterized protein n=1 Tax=Onychostoma macrolepis TaxID=369639 RepID=A0A7J6C5Z0_9TELE|nr:hypothetical protein G5714_017426 [Onychostoma macrolepis]
MFEMDRANPERVTLEVRQCSCVMFVQLLLKMKSRNDHGTLADHRPDPRPHPPWSTKPLFVHLTIIVTERPRDPCGPPPDPRPHPQVHETTICPFDHYSDGKTTGPLRTTARPQAPPPQVHKTTICPFDHYSDGKTTGPLRTGPPPPLVHETTICPLDHYSHGTTTGPLRTTAPTPGPSPPGPRNHYLSI